MTFRYARHCNDLKKMEEFYTKIAGLEKLGEFKDHDNYDGIFLGHPNMDWHLEFTTSSNKSVSKFDEDDSLVFYFHSQIELTEIKKTIKKTKIRIETPRNPYWLKNGLTISDPDGFKIIFSLKPLELKSEDPLTDLILEKKINNWSDLLNFVKQLPYGRNQNREDFSLVLKENKGTCSSKHALLKKTAELNKIENVKLVLGVYKMNHLNTPKIGNTILDSGLDYIPEAHCYLKINNKRYDLMSANSDIENLSEDILHEIEIEPEQVNIFKVEFHQDFLKKWIRENEIQLNFEKVWEVREACIKKLGE